MSEQTPETPETPELSEVEQQALELGWQPEEDFKADPKNSGKKWRSAEDFMDRKSLFDKIEEKGKEIKNLKKGIDSLVAHNKTIEQLTRERTIRELQGQRRKAIEEGELVKAEEIKDEIDALKTAPTQSLVTEQQEHPEYTQFKTVNPWYEKDVKMTAWADGMGALLARQGKSPSEVLREIHKLAREEFPEKFSTRNPNKDDAGAGSKTAPRRGSPKDDFALTEEQTRVMKRIIGSGAKITEAEYKAQLKKAMGY